MITYRCFFQALVEILEILASFNGNFNGFRKIMIYQVEILYFK